MSDGDTSEHDGKSEGVRRAFWAQKLGSLLVMGTAYVLVTAAFARVILLSDYDGMLEGLRAFGDAFGTGMSSLLVDGGIFAAIVHLIRKGIPETLADSVRDYTRPASPPRHDAPADHRSVDRPGG